MKSYPVRISRDPYRGRDQRRRRKAEEYNRVAHRVEKHLNDEISTWPDDEIGVFYSAMIAIDLREDEQLVHDVVFSIDCGHNGVTICKGDYERAMAMRSGG